MSEADRARQLASLALLRTEKGMLAQEALNAVLAEKNISPHARGLAADLFYGYLRNEIRLRHILAHFLKKPRKLPPSMLRSLGLGLLGLLEQSGGADYAIVDATVRAIKKSFGQNLAHVANGALRAMLRERESLLKPDFYAGKNCFQALAVFHSIPSSIAGLWREAWGEEIAARLMARSSQRPWPCLRLNRTRAGARTLAKSLGEMPETLPLGANGFAFPPGGAPKSIAGRNVESLHAEGALSWQAAGSQLVLEKLGLHEASAPLWDACAGVGGKSAALAESGARILLASDISGKRLGRLHGDFKRLGLPAPAIFLADAARPPLAVFSGDILLDIPCSGTGVLARRPDLRKRPFTPKGFVRKQLEMLNGAARLLKPGRKLACISCALNPEENERLVEAFLLARPDFRLETQWQTPHEHPWLEGMYGALLRKKA